jgi:hypothetical protein
MEFGDPVIWIAEPCHESGLGVVRPGDRGVFIDFNGEQSSLVVKFPGAGTFVCEAHEVRPA